jgi:hypothetical protein
MLSHRIQELEKMNENLTHIDVRSRPIVEGKIQLDVIFDGFKLFSMIVLKEFGVCYRILEHFQLGMEMMHSGKYEEFNQLTKQLLADIEAKW